MVGIASVLGFLYQTVSPITDYTVSFDGANDHIIFWNPALGAQPSEASLAIVQVSPAYITYISPAAVQQRDRDAGAAAITTSVTERSIRAAAGVLVDEINLVREWNTGLASAVAAAASLADLKTRVALLPALPDRTLSQAKTAIANKISSGAAD